MTVKRVEIKANLQSSLVSFVTHEEREYMVAPCVALVPGVLNNDLVTLDKVIETYQAWNGTPVVLDHPRENGQNISANRPDVIESTGLGQCWYADIEDKKLRVQVWIDVNKSKKLGGDALKVLDLVKEGLPVEVSTGYYAHLEEKGGSFNGEPYGHVTTLIIPDHLALLPNSVGACNWQDGCGIPRFLEGDKMTVKEDKKLASNVTVTDEFMMLATLVSAEMDEMGVEPWRWYLHEIEDNFAIIMMDQGLKRRPYRRNANGNVELQGEWEPVFQQTTFVPVSAPSEPAEPTANTQICKCMIQDNKEEDEAMDNDKKEVTTQEESNEEPEMQKDTLAEFLKANNVTENDLLASVELRKNQRKEKIEELKANTSLAEDELSLLSDSVLNGMCEALKSKQSTEEVETNSNNQEAFVEGMQNAGVYQGRGMPVQQTQPRTLKRPEVMRKRSA